MLSLKSETRKSFTVRLNLNNPLHRAAWEKLRNGTRSYTSAIVEALTAEEAPSSSFPDADMLKSIVRQAVSEALREMPAQPVIPSAESSGKNEISDEDFDIAGDFLSSLCG